LLITLNWLPLANLREYLRQTICRRGWTVADIHYDFDSLQKEVDRGRQLQAEGWPQQPYNSFNPFSRYSGPTALRRLEEALDKANVELNLPDPGSLQISVKTAFEDAGWDVVIYANVDKHGLAGEQLTLVELKPSLGDDYPAVLRQMKANSRNIPRYGDNPSHKVLIFDQFAASGAALDQVRGIFKASGCTLLALREVEQMRVPSVPSVPSVPPASARQPDP